MMSPSILGSSIGAAIGLLLCALTLLAGRRRLSSHVGASITYPPPDWRGAIKGAAILLTILVFLHWLPAMLSWIYASVLEKPFAIDERSFGALLFVAHVLAMTGMTTQLLGNLWATWRAPRRATMS